MWPGRDSRGLTAAGTCPSRRLQRESLELPPSATCCPAIVADMDATSTLRAVRPPVLGLSSRVRTPFGARQRVPHNGTWMVDRGAMVSSAEVSRSAWADWDLPAPYLALL